MGNQPAVLILARHGTRLDQADKDWHDKADKPWDSPLSYGGWIQAQSLGARIATELQNLDTSNGSDAWPKDGVAANSRPRKRRKITIHSSPYLRCIQTSIGIAAGLRSLQDAPRMRPVPTPFQRSSLSKPPMLVDDSTFTPSDEKTHIQGGIAHRVDNGLTDLKIDSWLGEWLSPGYFDKSQPPPPSQELVTSAKQMLKKSPEEIKGADMTTTSIQEFDEIEWADRPMDAKDVKAMPAHEKTGLRAMAAKGHSMPRRSRTVSLSVGQISNGTTPTSEPTGRRPRSTTYSPPIPTYSIAPKDTIPIGFVAHARDACIDADFEWDSEKPPLQWGDGGRYEEEWSTMHRRFRNGLQSMLSYYDVDESDSMDIEDGQSDEELVLILVTHQAGCNALIRLVTGAPALHDVGTASLTLAVRKPGLTRQESARSTSSTYNRRGSLDLGINNDFDMKIIASTEHLRPGSNPLGLNSPRLGMSPAFASRRLVGADSVEGFSIGDPLTWRSSSQTTVGRRSSTRHHTGGSISSESLSGSGLWSMRDARASSVSSDTSVDPKSSPTITPQTSTSNVTNTAVHEDEPMEDWASITSRHPQANLVTSPTSIEDQSIWQPLTGTTKVRLPVRSGSTKLSGTGATGLWGSPVSNPGGVKEGTPHSRGSFGLSDSATPTWGPRSSNQRFSFQSSMTDFGSMREEDES